MADKVNHGDIVVVEKRGLIARMGSALGGAFKIGALGTVAGGIIGTVTGGGEAMAEGVAEVMEKTAEAVPEATEKAAETVVQTVEEAAAERQEEVKQTIEKVKEIAPDLVNIHEGYTHIIESAAKGATVGAAVGAGGGFAKKENLRRLQAQTDERAI